MTNLFVCIVSVGGYSDTVSGRTTCAPCKAEWPSVASVLTSACTLVVDYSADKKHLNSLLVTYPNY